MRSLPQYSKAVFGWAVLVAGHFPDLLLQQLLDELAHTGLVSGQFVRDKEYCFSRTATGKIRSEPEAGNAVAALVVVGVAVTKLVCC